MSDSDSSSLSNSNSDSGEGFAENITLKPYDMEPTRSSLDLSSSSSSDTDGDKIEHINKTDWCKCGGFCRAMKTNCESLCCHDTNEILDEYFNGKDY